MREFKDLASFATFATGMVAAVDLAKHHALKHAAVVIETEAKRVIGTYDYGWPPLQPSTLARKNADTPLLETGEMRDSIEHTVGPTEAHVGSNNDKAVWHELGTSKVPPRPFLSGAAVRKIDEITKAIGKGVHGVLTSGGTADSGNAFDDVTKKLL